MANFVDSAGALISYGGRRPLFEIRVKGVPLRHNYCLFDVMAGDRI